MNFISNFPSLFKTCNKKKRILINEKKNKKKLLLNLNSKGSRILFERYTKRRRRRKKWFMTVYFASILQLGKKKVFEVFCSQNKNKSNKARSLLNLIKNFGYLKRYDLWSKNVTRWKAKDVFEEAKEIQ